MGWGRGQLHSFACGTPVVPVIFGEETIISPLHELDTFVENQLAGQVWATAPSQTALGFKFLEDRIRVWDSFLCFPVSHCSLPMGRYQAVNAWMCSVRPHEDGTSDNRLWVGSSSCSCLPGGRALCPCPPVWTPAASERSRPDLMVTWFCVALLFPVEPEISRPGPSDSPLPCPLVPKQATTALVFFFLSLRRAWECTYLPLPITGNITDTKMEREIHFLFFSPHAPLWCGNL